MLAFPARNVRTGSRASFGQHRSTSAITESGHQMAQSRPPGSVPSRHPLSLRIQKIAQPAGLRAEPLPRRAKLLHAVLAILTTALCGVYCDRWPHPRRAQIRLRPGQHLLASQLAAPGSASATPGGRAREKCGPSGGGRRSCLRTARSWLWPSGP